MDTDDPRRRARRRDVLVSVALATGLSLPVTGFSQPSGGDGCGELRNHYGPFDYRVERGEKLRIVEINHFNAGVESLTKPMTTTYAEMGGDVAYTLHVFPNHHRALMTMAKAGERARADKAPGAAFSVECYFVRATRFAPDDTVVRSLYARFLASKNRKEDATRQLEVATQYAGDNPLSHYNIGLIFFELGAYDRALSEAHRAQSLGLQRSGLSDMLKKVNKWQDPPPASTTEAAPS